MSLLGKPIEDVIETLYKSIKSKRQIITDIKKEYNIDNDSFNDIKINRFKLIDLLDEFEVTISQSLQAIQTFKVEIFNLKEKQTTEEILNLTNEFQMKYNSNENSNLINNNNILDKFECSKTENSNNEPKNEKNNNIINDKDNGLDNKYMNEIIKIKKEKNNNINNDNNNMKEFNILKEAKLNFDYSSLLNNSQSSLKTSISNLDKYRKHNQNENKDNKVDSNVNLETNIQNSQKENIIDNEMLNNNLNKEDIEEEQPSKLNINIIRSSNDILNNKKFGENKDSNKDISCFSDNRDFININNNNNDSYNNNTYNNNKYYSMREPEIINNINNNKSNQSFNYKFTLLNNKISNNNVNNNFEESDIISLVSQNDIIKEKFQKLEKDEKLNKLIEEIFTIKAFKLYILDKFGNGKQNIFFNKIHNGEINKEELETELNILKEIYNSNKELNSDNNNNNDSFLSESKITKNNKFMNKTLNKINLKMNIETENNLNNTDKYNNFKKIKHKKNVSLNNNKEECKTRYNNFKNKNRILYKTNNNSINNNKSSNINSHSISSIRAKIKLKKF